jgi:small subunit ribosomal protein S16
MRRAGSKKRPFFRIVVTEHSSPRDGRFVEVIGHYKATTSPETLVVDGERYAHWLEQLSEAFLSERVRLPAGASVSRFEMLLATKEHELQHRAQITVIDRLIGVVPRFTGLA